MEEWKKVKIGEFLFERKGKYKPDDEIITGLKRIHKIDFSGNFHIVQKPSKTNMILVCSGDLVISGINVAKGAMGIYHGEEDITATIHYSSYTSDMSKIEIGYFRRFLKSAEFIRLLQSQVKGGIKTEIKPKHLLALEIDLPDIQEQKQIVKYFERIETEDRELKQELTHQQSLLKKLRQQILQEAIEGNLSQDWRAKNPNAEPAGKLLKRIQAEKQQLIKDKKIKKQKPLPAISEAEKPFELPEGWAWCRLGDVINSYEAGKSFKCIGRQILNGEWGVIKTSAITSSEFIEAENKFYRTNVPIDISKKVNSGDLIFCRASGSKGLAGKCCLVKHITKNLLLSDKTPRLLVSTFIDKRFIFWLNETGLTTNYYSGLNTGKSTSMNNITKEQLLEKPLPLPPLAEQKAIVAKVEKLLSLCDQLQAQITQNQSHAEGLMQAVLTATFSQGNDKAKQMVLHGNTR